MSRYAKDTALNYWQ